MEVQDAINAEQARQNMKTASHDPAEAVASLNEAIREASAEHRGDTTVFLARDHIDTDELQRIIQHFRKRGFTVEDRCHDRDTFALKISWYPGTRRGA